MGTKTISILKFKRMVNALVHEKESRFGKLEQKKSVVLEDYKRLRELESQIIKTRTALKKVKNEEKSDSYKQEIKYLRNHIESIKKHIEDLRKN